MKTGLTSPLIAAGFGTVLFLAACDQRPEVDATLGPSPEGTAYPDLMSTQDILALGSSATVAETETDANAALEARADALRTRAAGL